MFGRVGLVDEVLLMSDFKVLSAIPALFFRLLCYNWGYLKGIRCSYFRNMASNKIAVEFIRFVLQQNPGVDDFATVYDAMSRAACARSFHNLGHKELAVAGISFSLLDTSRLEHLIYEAKHPSVS